YVSFNNKVTRADLLTKSSLSSLRGNWICLRLDGVVKLDIALAAIGGTNSMEAVNAIHDRYPNSLDSLLVRRIHKLLSRIGHWILRHIPREDNRKADGIAKFVQEMRERLLLFEASPLEN
ncbi:hypothetical protein Golob_025920, partial [Gossypium lobatum]|nr:hypothetical protein [Gossypium lobatum]